MECLCSKVSRMCFRFYSILANRTTIMKHFLFIILVLSFGVADAQFNLGLSYEIGQGTLQDYAEAVKWYRLAAAQGNVVAQHNLGGMYSNGRGVLQDYTKAHALYNLAASKGNAMAVKNRDLVAKRMTPQQIADAQKLARDCLARNFKGCD